MLSRKTKSWFMAAVNYILSLDSMQNFDLWLDHVASDKKTDTLFAYLKFTEHGVTIDWHLGYKDGVLYVKTATGDTIPLMSEANGTDFHISESNEAILKTLATNSFTSLLNIINQIMIFSLFVEDEGSEDYYRTYPKYSDYINGDSYEFDIRLVVNGKSAVSINDAKTVPVLMQPVGKVSKCTVDVIGQNDSVEEPLFRIWVANKQLAFARYTKKQTDLRGMLGFKLSTHVNHINLDGIDGTKLISEINENVKNDMTITDQLTEKTNLDKRIPKMYISWKDTLQANGVQNVVDANRTTKINWSKSVAYAVDDLPTVYVAKNSDIHVVVDHSGVERVCVKYTSPQFGTIAELHFNPDPKNIFNSDKLDSKDKSGQHENIFINLMNANAKLVYNSGDGEMESVTMPIVNAFNLVRSLLIIFSGMMDVNNIVKFNTSASAYGNAITRFDRVSVRTNYMVAISTESYAAQATMIVSSATNDKRLTVRFAVNPGAPKLIVKIPIPGYDKEIESVYDMTKNPSKSLMSDAMEYDRNKGSKGTLTIGGYIAGFIRLEFSQNMIEDKSGHVLNTSANQQTRVTNALRLQTKSPIGKALLIVRNAVLDTFCNEVPIKDGDTSTSMKTIQFIGTEKTPGVCKGYDIDDTYGHTSKKVVRKTADGKKYEENVPVTCSFSIANGDGGNFIAHYTRNKETGENVPHVYCEFTQSYREVTLTEDPDTHKRVLDDAFLRWYLIDNYQSNMLSQRILGKINTSPDMAAYSGISERIMKFYPKTNDETHYEQVPQKDHDFNFGDMMSTGTVPEEDHSAQFDPELAKLNQDEWNRVDPDLLKNFYREGDSAFEKNWNSYRDSKDYMNDIKKKAVQSALAKRKPAPENVVAKAEQPSDNTEQVDISDEDLLDI